MGARGGPHQVLRAVTTRAGAWTSSSHGHRSRKNNTTISLFLSLAAGAPDRHNIAHTGRYRGTTDETPSVNRIHVNVRVGRGNIMLLESHAKFMRLFIHEKLTDKSRHTARRSPRCLRRQRRRSVGLGRRCRITGLLHDTAVEIHQLKFLPHRYPMNNPGMLHKRNLKYCTSKQIYPPAT